MLIDIIPMQIARLAIDMQIRKLCQLLFAKEPCYLFMIYIQPIQCDVYNGPQSQFSAPPHMLSIYNLISTTIMNHHIVGYIIIGGNSPADRRTIWWWRKLWVACTTIQTYSIV